jgi:hypothetical protein
MKDKYIRIYYKTYLELRHLYPAQRGESMAEYFDRFINWVIVNSEVKE